MPLIDDIEVLPGLEVVRRRPAMFIGEVGPGAQVCLVAEAACLAAEQLIRGAATAASVIVAHDTIVITDDGDGLPVGRMRDGSSSPRRSSLS